MVYKLFQTPSPNLQLKNVTVVTRSGKSDQGKS